MVYEMFIVPGPDVKEDVIKTKQGAIFSRHYIKKLESVEKLWEK